MGRYLTDAALEPARLLAEVASPGCGGTVLFVGTVRRTAEDGDIEGIDYSAYHEMAEAELERIVCEAGERWRSARIALRHRLGWVAAGEASVAIAVACPHRADAYAASRFVIDETKRRVPIWKRERLCSGASRWVEPAHA
jgi:molybdopterin synthase catalytic subunit